MKWTHGGGRANSGRRKKCEELKARSVGFSAFPDLIEWINDEARAEGVSRSRFITEILEKVRGNAPQD